LTKIGKKKMQVWRIKNDRQMLEEQAEEVIL